MLHFQVTTSGTPLVPEVEIRPLSQPFTGQPNVAGQSMARSGPAGLPVSTLANGTRYHWQARATAAPGDSSPWVQFGATATSPFAVGVDRGAPSRPVISSPTDPNPHSWYNNSSVALRWSSADALSGVAGYVIQLQRSAHVIAPGPTTARSTIAISNLPQGVWFIALRAVDRAGNWSPTATFRVQLDRRPAHIKWLSPATTLLNPYKGAATFRFSVDKTVGVHIQVYRVGSRTPIVTYGEQALAAGKAETLAWSGKDAQGKPLPKGYYFFVVKAVDHAGNVTSSNFGGVELDPVKPTPIAAGQMAFPTDGKRIIVSLSQQELFAYNGTHLLVQTLVTTGNPALPTPPGHYAVLGKFHPYEFVSPWPPGSPYWYPPSLSNFALLFRDGGYFLHDAPWRGVFGPGTNGPGQPGTNYGGTHGCVNIPSSPMIVLYGWADVGTPVDVVP